MRSSGAHACTEQGRWLVVVLQFEAAIAAFEAALKLQPQDYSLWNKLGATLANNGRR